MYIGRLLFTHLYIGKLLKLNGKMTNLAPNSRVRGSRKSNSKFPALPLNKTEDFNNIVVMSGTAKRRRLETEEKPSVTCLEKGDFKKNFLKLRAPFQKSHQKQASTEEKVMTKSCEVLIECIKSSKDIRVSRRTQMTESTRTFGRILTTDVVYEGKATRNVQFVSYSEVDGYPMSYMERPLSVLVSSGSAVSGKPEETTREDFQKTEHKPAERRTAVSSEDFITRVFPPSKSMYV